MAFENFNKLITYFRKIQEADLFPIVAVTGPLGLGKSSFSIQCSAKYCAEYLNEKYHFSCIKYIAYDNQEVISKYYNLPEYSPLIADEASRFAMGEDWNKYENKELKKITAQIRPRHLLFFMNIPNFTWMDSKYKDELIRLWVWIPIRGYAVIFEPDNNPGERDKWHLKDFTKYKKRISQFTNIDKVYSMACKHKCFFDIIKFPKVPKPIYDKYMELRNKKTFKDALEEFTDQKEIAKIMSYNIKYNWEKIQMAIEGSRFEKPTYRMIADILLKHPITGEGFQFTTVRNWVNEVLSKIPQQKTLEVEANADSKI